MFSKISLIGKKNSKNSFEKFFRRQLLKKEKRENFIYKKYHSSKHHEASRSISSNKFEINEANDSRL